MDRAVWLAVALTLILAVGAMARLLAVRLQLGAMGPPAYSPERVPSTALATRRAELEKVRAERMQLDRGLQSTRQAIAMLFEASDPETFRAANSFLARAAIKPDEERLVVDALLSDSVSLSMVGLDLLARHGKPEDGERLSRKAPPAQGIGAWFDLLAKWSAAPTDDVLAFLLGDERSAPICAAALAQRKLALHPAAVEAMVRGNLPPAAKAQLVETLPEEDRRAVQVLSMLAVSEPIPEAVAAGLQSDPPSDKLLERIYEAIKTTPTTIGNPWEFIERMVPSLFALDEPRLWNWLEEKLRYDPRGGVVPEMHRVRAALTARLERSPSAGAARAIAASAPPDGRSPAWPLTDLLRRRPELRELAGIPEPTAEPAVEAGPAVRPEEINSALAALRSADAEAIEAAYQSLVQTPLDESRRSEVIAALESPGRGMLSSSRSAQVAYCRWAGPASQAYLAHLATLDDDEVRTAAVKALVEQKSPRLAEVARRQLGQGRWSTAIIAAWSDSGPVGEAALCQAIGQVGLKNADTQAIKSLAQCGGERALRFLEALRDGAPPGPAGDRTQTKLKEIDDAIEQIQQRVSSSKSKAASESQAAADQGKSE